MGSNKKKKNKQKQKGKRRTNAGPDNKRESQQREHSAAGSVGGGGEHEHRAMYARYKEATRSFRDGLSKLLPDSIPLTSVSDLGNAVEYLLQESEKGEVASSPVVGIGLLSCLNVSIKLREKITTDAGGDGDEGHAYMNKMLRYCQGVLRQCRKIFVESKPSSNKVAAQGSKADSANSENHNGLSHRFGALNMDEGREGEESDEEEGDQKPAERPPDPKREYSIERDLIEGDNSMQARMYITQLNHLLDMIYWQYGWFKARVESWKSDSEFDEKVFDTALVMNTVMAAANTNLALEEMKHLEEAVIAECPQFKTFYHVIAVLVFPGLIPPLENIINPSVRANKPHLALDFVAREVEHGFRTPAYPGFVGAEKRAEIFSKRAKVAKSDKKLPFNTAQLVLSLTLLEVGPDYVVKDERVQQQVNWCREVRDQFSQQLVEMEVGVDSSHYLEKMWGVLDMGRNRFVKAKEGDCRLANIRGLLRIQSMLQSWTHSLQRLSDEGTMVIDPQTTTVLAQSPWDENCNKAKGIHDPRMEDFFTRIFFPPFFNKAKEHGVKSQLMFDAYFKKLLPRVFPLLQGMLNFQKDRDSIVPFSFTLAVHAMLTGVLELQGYLQRIAIASKAASEKYYEQIQWLIDKQQNPNVEQILKRIKLLENASMPFFDESLDTTHNLLAFWNPLTAGCYLTQVTHLNNLWNTHLLDYQNQTTTMLHLFNALRARKLLKDDDISLLSVIDTTLDGCKNIWGDGKPTKDFCKNFFIASGFPLSASKSMAEFIAVAPMKNIEDAFANASKEKMAALEKYHKYTNFAMDKDIAVARMQVLIGMRGVLKHGARHKARMVCPEDVCVSYRYIVEGDFSGLDEHGHGNSISALSTMGAATSFLDYHFRQKDLEVKIMEEMVQLLPVNLPKLAWVLNDTLNKLATYMDWDGLIDKCCTGFMSSWKMTYEQKKYCSLNALIGDRIFGELDFERKYDNCMESKRCADFLKSHLNSIRREDIYFC